METYRYERSKTNTFIKVMAIMGIPAYVSKKLKQFFAYSVTKHITGIPNNTTCQAVLEGSNQTIKDTLNKQKRMGNTPQK